ncbi:MAG TPA: hypothetical protein VND20_11515 [Candidatus Binataceae bacterium]|nr:hypothetical protein [Candidatus Binataceae bacterium]
MQSQASEYRNEIWRRTKEKTQLLQPWRIYSGVGSAIVSPFIQWKVGRLTVLSAALWLSAVGLAVYAVLTAGEYTYKALFVIPGEIWQENKSLIAELRQELREMRETEWPVAFKAQTREAIVGMLAGTFASFTIYHNPLSNCADFAVALSDVLKEGGWRSQQMAPVQSGPRIPAGVRIEGGEKQVTALARTLKEALNIDARVTVAEVNGGMQILIGERRGPF